MPYVLLVQPGLACRLYPRHPNSFNMKLYKIGRKFAKLVVISSLLSCHLMLREAGFDEVTAEDQIDQLIRVLQKELNVIKSRKYHKGDSNLQDRVNRILH